MAIDIHVQEEQVSVSIEKETKVKFVEVEVKVDPILQSKTATENGIVVPDSGYDGLSQVAVNVPEKEPILQNKTITENGTYSADEGFDGLGEIIVEVEGGGGDSDVEVTCVVYVVAPVGSEVTCTSTPAKIEHTDGIWEFHLTGRGGFTVTATKENWTVSKDMHTGYKKVCFVNLCPCSLVLEENTWEEIVSMANNGTVPETWLGQIIPLTLTTNEVVNMQVAGIYHDNLSDGSGKASLTFISQNLLNTYRGMNTTTTNSGGWGGNPTLRTVCNGELYNSIPENVRTAIKSVKKLSDGGYNSTSLVETNDYCWLPSVTEVDGDKSGQGNVTTLKGQGECYPIFYGYNPRIKSKIGGSAYHWRLRSSHTTSSYQWAFVGSSAYISMDGCTATFGIPLCFCI